jgi:hypothetical protein
VARDRCEERFLLDLGPEDVVTFRIVAFSAPRRCYTRLGGPAARLSERRITRRYLDALDRRRSPNIEMTDRVMRPIADRSDLRPTTCIRTCAALTT